MVKLAHSVWGETTEWFLDGSYCEKQISDLEGCSLLTGFIFKSADKVGNAAQGAFNKKHSWKLPLARPEREVRAAPPPRPPATIEPPDNVGNGTSDSARKSGQLLERLK